MSFKFFSFRYSTYSFFLVALLFLPIQISPIKFAVVLILTYNKLILQQLNSAEGLQKRNGSHYIIAKEFTK